MPTIHDDTFEQHFSELALATLRSQIPALLDYMLGFQLVEKNEEDTRAVGFFAFQIGNTWTYIPVFFLNGQVKGTELMYVKGQDMMLPSEEAWVNELIKKKPRELGKGSLDEKGKNVSAPDLRRFREPPGTMKTSSFLVERVVNDLRRGTKLADWAQPFAKVANELVIPQSPALNLPKMLEALDVRDVFLNSIVSNAKLANATLQYYTLDELYVPSKPKVKVATYTHTPKATVLSLENIKQASEIGTLLTDGEKASLMRGEVIVLDPRPEEKIAKLLDLDASKYLQNPSVPGLYDMLVRDGSFRKTYVARVVTLGSGQSNGVYAAIDVETGNVGYYPCTAIWVGPDFYTREETLKAFKSIGSSISSLNDTYRRHPDTSDGFTPHPNCCILTEGGECTLDFDICDSYQREDGSKVYEAHQSTFRFRDNISDNREIINHDRKNHRPIADLPMDNAYLWSDSGSVDIRVGRNSSDFIDSPTYGERVKIIIPKKTTGAPLVRSLGACVVNSDRVRLVKCDSYTFCGIDLTPGTTADLHVGIGKLAESVDLLKTSGQVKLSFNDAEYVTTDKKGFYEVAVNELQLGLQDTDYLWRKVASMASPSRRSMWLQQPKQASAFDAALSRAFGFEDGHRTEETVEDTFDLPETAFKGNADMYKHVPGGESPDFSHTYDNSMRAIEEAAATGQKDVFDAAALGSLIKTHDVSGAIDSFIPDLMRSLDRLGRILFLSYWHMDDLKDRYGETELSKMQDDVKNSFQSLGDIIIDLRQRSATAGDDYGIGLLDLN